MATVEHHIGRSFGGPGHIEEQCPCPKAPCGLVISNLRDEGCAQHGMIKTIRSGHPAEECEGEGHYG